jgi:hypothetical protein
MFALVPLSRGPVVLFGSAKMSFPFPTSLPTIGPVRDAPLVRPRDHGRQPALKRARSKELSAKGSASIPSLNPQLITLNRSLSPRVAEGPPSSTSARPQKLLDRVRWHLRVKRYSIRTEQAYVDWIRRFTP